MKNNKGLILSTYIYILLVFFIILLTTMLMVLNNTKLLATKIKENASDITKSEYDDFSIILLGNQTKGVLKGTTYVDDGYSAESKTGKSIIATVESTVNMNVVGTYTYKYTVRYGGISKSVTRNVNVVDTEITYNYTGSAQTFVSKISGYYKVELWGAAGNKWNGLNNPGLGGYTSGVIYLNANETLYVYVGSNATAFNGGSVGGAIAQTEVGGGATDVRLVGGNWNDTQSLYSRIMVAGAGGGTGEASGKGGDGGNLIGGAGATAGSGSGGGQAIGGAGGTTTTVGSPGGFGYGGAGGIEASYGIGGSGGSGYYGGGGGSGIAGTDGAGGGGSSFISGFAGVTATTGNTNHSSGKYFTDASMQAGVRSGTGLAKITFISTTAPTRINTNLNNVRYIKDCINGSTFSTNNNWVELQAIYNGKNVAYNSNVEGTAAANVSYPYSRITDGNIDSEAYAQTDSTGLQCITVDLNQIYSLEEISVWHKWLDGRTYYSNTTYVSSDNTNWTTVISNSQAETSMGKRVSARPQNIISNSDFSSYTTTSYAWDNTLNRSPAIVPTGWFGGYNSGVASPSLGYHARFDNAPFGNIVIVFPNLNSTVNLTGRWMGINVGITSGTITPSTTYVLSMDIYGNTVGQKITGGIYSYNDSTSTWGFGSAVYSLTVATSEINKWVTKQVTFTTPSTVSLTNNTIFYIYGYTGSEGTAYIKNIYLVKQ